MARQLSQPYKLASALCFAASLHVLRREAQLVHELAEATIVLSREHGFIRWLGGGLIRRGWALAALGSAEEGIEQIRQGIATWREMGTKQAEVQHLTMLAEAYKTGGQIEAGLRVLAEAFRLYAEGYASTEDIDKTVRDGLGLRWSFMGPFETIDLNAPGGMVDYCERYGELYYEMAQTQLPRRWDEALVRRIERERRQRLPASELDARSAWRDRRLIELIAHKRRAAEQD